LSGQQQIVILNYQKKKVILEFMKYLLAISLVFLSSCSVVKERNKTRELQSEILREIKANNMAFSRCAKDTKIFDHFEQDRVRVELKIMLNHKGEIERFQTDEKKYPEAFLDCVYKILDKTKFPKLAQGEAVQFTQPFLFRRD
jgi:hypothetical protein